MTAGPQPPIEPGAATPGPVRMRITKLDEAGQPIGEAVEAWATSVIVALVPVVEAVADAFVTLARNLSAVFTVPFTEALAALLASLGADRPQIAREYAIDRLDIAESDIRSVHLHPNGGGMVRLWNGRRIVLPADWWPL